MSISAFPYAEGRARRQAQSRARAKAIPAAGAPVPDRYAVMISELEALSRTRALTDAESLKLERAIRRGKQQVEA